jgi:UDP-glucose 4-epimerase
MQGGVVCRVYHYSGCNYATLAQRGVCKAIMTILVTGGAGYIGSVVAEALLDDGNKVVVYDNLVRGHRAAVPPEADFVQADLADREALAAAFRRYDFEAVLHFAAFLEVGESMKNPALFFRNNVANSLNLIEAAVEAGVEKFVFSSTCAVYQAQDRPLSEDDPLGPASVYGETKLMIERMLRWFSQIHGLRYAALRYFNAAGATTERGEDHRPETHLIPLILQVPLGHRRELHIYGTDYPTQDGTCIRDYIHIADLASAHLLALTALDRREQLTCNLGNGAGYSVRQVIEVAREVTGQPIPALETPRRPGDPAILVAGAGRAKEELGWEPNYPALRDIIASAWEWHQAHPNGYEG